MGVNNSIFFCSKIYDQNSIYQAIVDFIYIDCDELRKDEGVIEDEYNKKRRSEELKEEDCLKKRKTSNEACDMIHLKQSDKADK